MTDSTSPAVPVPTVTATELRGLLVEARGSFFVLDVRPRDAYERGHVPGSLHCPVHEMSKRKRDLPPQSSTVVVVGEPGSRGRAGAVFLLVTGYGSVVLLDGGFPAWDGAVETGPGRPLTSSRPPKPEGWTDPPSPS